MHDTIIPFDKLFLTIIGTNWYLAKCLNLNVNVFRHWSGVAAPSLEEEESGDTNIIYSYMLEYKGGVSVAANENEGVVMNSLPHVKV